MANKDKLKEMLKARNPLLEAKREAVIPVDLYTKPQTDKTTTPQEASRPNDDPDEYRMDNIIKTLERIQKEKTTKPQTGKTTKLQTGKTVKPHVVKYTTHLTPATIKALKIRGAEADQKDYEIVEEAIKAYLKGDTPHK